MQTVQLSCIKISTISEHTKSSLHLSLYNYEYHRVLPKWFLRLWCIRQKPCTDQTELPLEPLHRSTNRCFQNGFLDYGALGANHAHILHISCTETNRCFQNLASSLALSPNRMKRASTWAPTPRSTNKCVQNGFLEYGALGVNCAPILHWN